MVLQRIRRSGPAMCAGRSVNAPAAPATVGKPCAVAASPHAGLV